MTSGIFIVARMTLLGLPALIHGQVKTHVMESLSDAIDTTITSMDVTSRLENELLNVWFIETVDDEDGAVGDQSSMALDNNQKLHISYVHFTDNKVKYAKFSGWSWEIEKIDSFNTWVGYTSIAIDSRDYPHISYSGDWQLKYARWNGLEWEITRLDSVDGPWHSCGNSIALDNNDYPCIAYGDGSYDNLLYTRWDGTEWQTELVENADQIAVFNEFLCLDENQYPHISYNSSRYNGAVFVAMYAYWDGITWQKDTIAKYLTTGYRVTLKLDVDNNPNAAYQKNTSDVYYAEKLGSIWQSEFVQDVSTGARSLSLALDGNGTPHLAYKDGRQLKYATCYGNEWFVETVDSAPWLMGFDASIIIDGDGFIHICYCDGYWSSNRAKLKYASSKFPHCVPQEVGCPKKTQFLEVYPNPFTASTNVQYLISNNNHQITFKIYDVAGRLVETTDKTTIAKNLLPGIYFLITKNSKPTKIIKVR